MKPESFDRTVTIERAAVTQDEGSGENVETWSTLASVQAEYKPASDGEKVQAGEVASTLMARFVVRYDSAISNVNPKDRLVFEGRTFDIVGAKEVAGTRRALIEITAAARAD
jgi:SPP1 family predicted phage head-tail adaptor